MKYKIIFCLLVGFLSFSQERIDGPDFKFKSIGKSINEAVGWRFDYFENKWVKTVKDSINHCPRENKIQKVESEIEASAFYDYEEKETFYPMSFHSIFFTKIYYKKDLLYILNIVLVKEKFNPNHQQTLISSFIFNEDEFLKMKKFNNGFTECWNFNTLVKNKSIDAMVLQDLELNTKNVLLKECWLNGNCDAWEPGNYEFKIKLYKNTVRFILPFECLYCDDLKNEYSFDKAYFETDLKSFKLLFEL